MSYEIQAWLDAGRPKLQILDADSGCVRMAWQAPLPSFSLRVFFSSRTEADHGATDTDQRCRLGVMPKQALSQFIDESLED